MNLNQVTLPVTNMTEACLFYRKLGFTQIVDTAHYARFKSPMGESSFSLALNDQSINKQADEPHQIAPAITIYFEHPQLDEWVAQLVAKGIEFEQLPQDMRYLWREAVLFDPSGNKIKLYWAGQNRLNPPWQVELGPL
ncbi:VOC family protein [Shewanella maritima]|uniref:VOC family protein n=1 Tax=Shewanella maritima TaxID=2520507 RepID=UPI0037351BBB